MEITRELKANTLRVITAIDSLKESHGVEVTGWEYKRDKLGLIRSIRIEVTDIADPSQKTSFVMAI